MNKRFYFVIIVLIVLLLYGCQILSNQDVKGAPKALGGVLAMDAGSQIIPLNGKWEFYWKALLYPGDFYTSGKDSNLIRPTGYFKVPSDWKNYISDGKKLPVYGYATYRLLIQNAVTNRIYGLKIRYIDSAYRLYVNGQLLGEVGTLATNEKSFWGNYLPEVYTFYNRNPEIEIIIQVANYYTPRSGIRESIWLGDPGLLVKSSQNHTALDLSVFGCLLAIGLYHLFLYLLRRMDKSVLFFGFLCIVLAIHTIFMGEMFIVKFIPVIYSHIAMKIILETVVAEFIAACCYVYYLYPGIFNKRYFIFNIAFGVLYSLFIIATEYGVYYRFMPVFYIIAIVAGLYILFILFKAILMKREAAIFVLSGFIFYFLSVVKDMLTAEYILYSVYIQHIGVLAFVFSQTAVLSYRFSNAFRTVEKLSKDLGKANRTLEAVNQNLEKIVDERTRDLRNEIEEKVKVERRLFFSEKHFHEMADFLPSIILETDLSGNMSYINNKGLKAFGIETISRNSKINLIDDLIVTEDREKAGNDLKRLLEGEEFETKEYRFKFAINNNGSEKKIMALVNCGLIKNENQINGFRWTVIDIQTILDSALLPEEILYQEFHFTKMEKNVLRELLLGYNNKEISSRLFISINTLKTHISNIYNVMEVKNREEFFKLVAQYHSLRLGRDKKIRYLLQNVIKESL